MEQDYIVKGTIVDRNNHPIKGLVVEAWDKDLLFDDKLGREETDDKGKFIIRFETKKFKNFFFFDRKPDIYFKIFRGETMIHSTKDSVMRNVEWRDYIPVPDIKLDEVVSEPASEALTPVSKLGTTRNLLQATYTPRKPRPDEDPSLRARGVEKASFIFQLAPSRDELEELAKLNEQSPEKSSPDTAMNDGYSRSLKIISEAIAPSGRINVLRSAKPFAYLDVDTICRLARELADLRQAKLESLEIPHNRILRKIAEESLEHKEKLAPTSSAKEALEWAISNDVDSESARRTKDIANCLSIDLQKINLSSFSAMALDKINRLRDEADQCNEDLKAEPIGYLHLEKMSFTPVGIERGELVYSVPLSPGEEVNIRHREWSRTSEEFERIVTDYKEEFSEEGVTEKTELAQSVNSQTQHATAFNTSVSTSGEAWGFSISASVGYNASESSNKSEQLTRNHSRELTSKASSRSKQEHKISFRVASASESENEKVQKIKNPFLDRATRVDYYQLIRKWQVDLYRCGIRLTWDVTVPEPGSELLSKLRDISRIRSLLQNKFTFDIALVELEQNYTHLAAKYGVSTEPPPPYMKEYTFSKNYGLNTEAPVPEGDRIIFNEQVIIEENYDLHHIYLNIDHNLGNLGGIKILYNNKTLYEYQMNPFIVTINAAIDKPYCPSIDDTSKSVAIFKISMSSVTSAAIDIHVVCVRAPIALELWQIKFYNNLQESAETQFLLEQQKLRERLAQLEEELGAQDALSLRKKEREEVMKQVLRFLLYSLCPGHFRFFPDGIFSDANMNKSIEEILYNPETGLIYNKTIEGSSLTTYHQALIEHGKIVKFLHHAIEWENMLYFLYPYFWTHPSQWEFKKYLEHPDPQHKAFLKAGSARVVLTIRPGFEDAFLAFINTGEIEGLPQSPYLEIGQEFKNYASTNYPGIRPANPVESARPLLTYKQKQTWEKMQSIIQYLEEYRLWPNAIQLKAWKEMLSIKQLINKHYQKYESYPSDLDNLVQLFPTPVISRIDPWGNRYMYRQGGDPQKFELKSLGADGESGGKGINSDIYVATFDNSDLTAPEFNREYPDSLVALGIYFKEEPFFDSKGDWKKDSWGNEFRYRFPGNYGDYDLESYGADGKEGGEGEDADITNWAEASLIGTWYEYTPTSALDIEFEQKIPQR